MTSQAIELEQQESLTRISSDDAEEELASDETAPRKSSMTNGQERALLACHALSTWNARTYEFAAILFTARAFPGTLLMSSLSKHGTLETLFAPSEEGRALTAARGLFTNLALILFSSYIGDAIDRSHSRLRPLMLSITSNRASILLASVVWILLFRVISPEDPRPGDDADNVFPLRLAVFSLAVCIGIVERLSGMANMISMEREWVPALCLYAYEAQDQQVLTRLNALMRRIDLICKLVSPLTISGLIEMTSVESGVLAVGTLSGVCWPCEYFLTRHVWNTNPALQQTKARPDDNNGVNHEESDIRDSYLARLGDSILKQVGQVRRYLATDVWQPSFALSLLHLSALSYSATFITFMLSEGFSLLVVTIARAFGSIVEISSTFVAPLGISRLARCNGKCSNADVRGRFARIGGDIDNQGDSPMTENHDVGLARSGLWGLTLQFACLVPVVLAISHISKVNPPFDSSLPQDTPSTITSSSSQTVTIATVAMIFLPLSFSRLGLWVFDLTTQEITQTHVPPSQRSSFAGTETALSSFFELCQWMAAAVLSDPRDFRWLAWGSLGAVGVSLVISARWVRRRRGHLVHWDRIKGGVTGWAK